MKRKIFPFKRFILLDVITEPSIRPILIWSIFLLLFGAVFYHAVEGWNWIDSFFFCIVTLTTVGYGDLTPVKPVSKLFTMLYIINGIGILLALVNAIYYTRQEKRNKEKTSRFSADTD